MSDGFFLIYLLLELVSGVLLVLLAVRGYGLRTRGRVLSAVIGAACLIQAGYLVFFFDGGHYTIGVWPFVGPIYAVIRMVRYRLGVRAEEQATANRMWGPAGMPTRTPPVVAQGGQSQAWSPVAVQGDPPLAWSPSAVQGDQPPAWSPVGAPPAWSPVGAPPAWVPGVVQQGYGQSDHRSSGQADFAPPPLPPHDGR